MVVIRSLIALLMAFIATPAAAQSCGDTLSQNTRLTRDVNCPAISPWALRIDTPGVVLDLNGYNVLGSTTGIFVDGADDVAITGPGLIKGVICRAFGTFAGAGVWAVDADRLSVSGVAFAQLGRAVYLEGVSSSRIFDNTISATDYGFFVLDAPARQRPARDNEISKNTMVGDPWCGMAGAWIEGDGAQDNLLYANRFEGVYNGALLAASNNRIVANTHVGVGLPPRPYGLIGAGVQVAAGFDNRIVGNLIENTSTGVYLSSFSYGLGTGALTLDTAGNEVIANRIVASHYGILVGDIGGQAGGIAYKNRIGDNQIERARIGLFFELNSYANDGRGNGYRGGGTPVLDFGSGNLWP